MPKEKKKGLDFCPYEAIYNKEEEFFVPLDRKALAYEIRFLGKHTYEELGETVLAGVYEGLLEKKLDEKRKEFCGDEKPAYILDGRSSNGRLTAMDKLKKAIDDGNGQSTGENTPQGYDIDDTAASITTGYKLEYVDKPDGTCEIRYAENSGRVQETIMKAYPCCPSCHRRLPIGWLEANDFCGISLIARTTGGKTTYLVSMMTEDWNCFSYNEDGLTIESAHITSSSFEGKEEALDRDYRDLAEYAISMQNGEIVFGGTQRTERVAPVFLNVKYKDYELIVGIYDNSGEVLAEMTTDEIKTAVIPHMFAHIYLIDPQQLDGYEENTTLHEEEQTARLLSLEEQGNLQREQGDKKIQAFSEQRNIVGVHRRAKKKSGDVLAMYRTMKKVVGNTRRGALGAQHLACVLAKCDLLENQDIMAELGNDANLLFIHDDELEDANVDIRAAINQIEKRAIENFVLSQRQIRLLERDMGSVSYHFISALGCSTEKKTDGNGFVLKDDYSPIRVAEPLLACIRKKLEVNGWYED